MSERFIYWYQREWSSRAVDHLVGALERAGWALPHPTTGEMLTFSVDGAAPIQRDALIEALALTGPTVEQNTHWWLDRGGANVYYRIRRPPAGGVVHEFGLEGAGNDMGRIEQDILGQVRESASTTTGVVFDREGATQDVEWDAVMAGADVPLDEFPDLLIWTRELDRLHPDLPYRHRIYELDGLVIHDWEGLYRNDSEPDRAAGSDPGMN